MRSNWVVSPNVKNKNATVPDWKRASLREHAAFMGWGLDRRIGRRFAQKIEPGDVILIARRYKFKPEIVGFGVVRGRYKHTIKGLETPDNFGSMRKLSPFVPKSEAPAHIRKPLFEALGYTSALAKLHPNRRSAHALVCNWMEGLLSNSRKRSGPKKASPQVEAGLKGAHIAAPPGNYQLDYKVRSKKQIIKAEKNEARLLIDYRQWLERQGRKLPTAKYGTLQCDGFEEERRNLIEAKSSTSREHIRMAVGQLLDYAFRGEKKFGKPNMGILLPKKPEPKSVEWLRPLKIGLIWREKDDFRDNAKGKFT